jgi:cytochrome d ubiquinol oxidase subunit I
VKGLKEFPRDQWPDNIPLLLQLSHQVGLGTIFVLIMLSALVLLWRKRLYQSRWML